MRLIDADKLIDDMKKELEKAVNDENLDKAECMVIMTSAIALKDFVNRQPTAYDFDKVIGQYKWERDIAMYQLEQLGIGFGQKLEDEVIEKVKEVIRCV